MTSQRLRALRVAAFALACVAATPMLATGARAEEAWPTKQPIRLVVPFPPGSALDAVARPVFEIVSKSVGQTFVFESKPGAGGTIGMNMAAKADADGYTFLVNSSVHTIVPTTYGHLPFNTTKDLRAVIPLAQFPDVLVVPPSRFKTVQELVAAAKAKPDTITFGSGGVGAATQLNAERFRQSADFTAVHVPFKGASEALREILGDRIDFYFSPLPAVTPLIKSGKVRALAVSSKQRSAAIPDVPTTIESGYANSDYIFWVGVFAPAGVPKEIVDRLHDEVAKALKDPSVVALYAKLGADPMPMTPSEFDGYIDAEIESNAKVIKAAGIKPN